MSDETYESLVREVYLNPIRSVLIIDDDYPTLDEIFTANADGENAIVNVGEKRWLKNAPQIKQRLEEFRKPGLPLIVDIHDASGSTKDLHHLHQSDLLVLDFELDRDKKGNGDIAIEILRKLLSNEYFNLVVVHTAAGMDKVFFDVLTGLLGEKFELAEVGGQVNPEDAIVAAIDIDAKYEGAFSEAVGLQQYLEVRRDPCNWKKAVKNGLGAFEQFSNIGKELSWKTDTLLKVFRFLILQMHSELSDKLSPLNDIKVFWRSGTIKWIRSENAFIAFSEKSDTTPILDALSKALVDWEPLPSRLFLTKLRSELDQRGIAYQDQAIADRKAHATWYYEMLEKNGSERYWLTKTTVSRHVDQLLSRISDGIDVYADRLVNSDRSSGDDSIAIAKRRFGVDLNDKKQHLDAIVQHNVYVSNLPELGSRLEIGHVFRSGSGESHWICLTPACDMVFSQLSSLYKSELPGFVPVNVIRLHNVELEAAAKYAGYGQVIFFQEGGKTLARSFTQLSEPHSQPIWQQVYFGNEGKLTPDNKIEIHQPRINKENKTLVAEKESATVVAKLRYEYALALLQRLGGAMTRVGLDYQSVSDRS